ncbi:hypothetical protein Ppa06_09490 [Planomonospora parontospora subsp. parontospora]|uniref:Uncharacterized protein n=2 Tax=Planomonospora parontospora TaxID=58119 RepID=A0AA37F2N3_9ACTN|nr:hypothetical protein GCM10010126_07120 [Planomonospora parontospora]GII07151.1 hypothetical protein Ppa06_09490 [Planomonospora parontospora subsp. parontospora]
MKEPLRIFAPSGMKSHYRGNPHMSQRLRLRDPAVHAGGGASSCPAAGQGMLEKRRVFLGRTIPAAPGVPPLP